MIPDSHLFAECLAITIQIYRANVTKQEGSVFPRKYTARSLEEQSFVVPRVNRGRDCCSVIRHVIL